MTLAADTLEDLRRTVARFGGAGSMAEYPIERLYRDARLFRLYEGTSQIQPILIGRSMIAGASIKFEEDPS
jgi:acyl-CoA dehydrogenase